MQSQPQKFEKYLNSKNDFKKLLGPFNKELWTIYVFLKGGKISRAYTPTASVHELTFFSFRVQQKPYTSERRKREFSQWVGEWVGIKMVLQFFYF